MKKFSIRTFLVFSLCLLLSINSFAAQVNSNTSKASNHLKFVYSSPENNSSNAGIYSPITVAFNKSIKKGSNFSKISLIDSHKKQVAIITSISGSEIRIKSKYKLKYSTNYTLTVPANAIKDMNNNSYNKAITSKFKTANKVWLSILGSNPLDNDVSVKRDATISVYFNYGIKKGTKFKDITLTSPKGEKIDLSLAIKGNTLTVSLNEKLDYSTDHILTIPVNALMDYENFPNNKVMTVKFKSCNENLSVLETLPADNASGVYPKQPLIVVFFDRDIYKDIAFDDISLMDSSKNTVSLEMSIGYTRLDIRPDTNLKYGTEYILNVPANAVKDENGFSYDKEISIKFKTTDIKAYSSYKDYQAGTILKEDGTVWTQDYSNNQVVQTKKLSGVTVIAAGSRFFAALKEDGTVWTWGSTNYNGQLGNGTNKKSDDPVQVKNLSGVTTIASGKNYCLALKEDGTVWAWGDNGAGQLGNGTYSDSNIPMQVKNLSGVTAVAAGIYHSMALKEDGTVWTWGSNVVGQLGAGTGIGYSNKPVQVKNLSGVTYITAGKGYSMALKEDGTVWTWGDNIYGQLGDGTYLDSNEPVQVKNLTDITAIRAYNVYEYWEYGTIVALKKDGTVWTWGEGTSILGNPDVIVSNIPIRIKALSEITSIKVNSTYGVAYKSDGIVWVWGKMTLGEPTLVE